MKNIAYAIKTLLTLVSSPKITVTNAEGSDGRFYRRLGLGLLLAAFALTPNCPGSSSSNGGGNPQPTTVTYELVVSAPSGGSIGVVYTSFTATCNDGAAEDCTYRIAEGTRVTLTATASPDFEFTSGSADCSGTGTGTCTLIMSEDRTASAIFTSTLRTLTVTPPMNGSIAVGAPVGLTCDSATSPTAEECTYSDISDGTTVTLTATGEAGTTGEEGYIFGSWEGACSGTSDNMCVLTMSEDRTAGASFVACDPDNAALDCDQDGTNNGEDAFPLNQDVVDAVALFSLGEMDGDFGFDACQTFLDNATSAEASTPRSVDMYDRGFRTARFFGSTPTYDFHQLDDGTNGLALSGNALDLPVAAFTDNGTVSTHGFPVSTGTTKITIRNLASVSGNGDWNTATPNLFANALAPVIVDANNEFWSFTNGNAYISGDSCNGATSNSGGPLGNIGNMNAIDAVSGSASAGNACNTMVDVLCVAKR